MEAIQALGSPTVNEFATFMRISPPNAAYKVNSLIKKGYIRKVQSSDDRREYHLEITQKYIDYYNISTAYMTAVMNRITQRFTPAECAKLEEMLTIISRELMAEVEIPDALSGQATKEAAQADSLCRFLFKTVPPECGYPLWGPSPRQSPPAGSPRFWVLPRG